MGVEYAASVDASYGGARERFRRPRMIIAAVSMVRPAMRITAARAANATGETDAPISRKRLGSCTTEQAALGCSRCSSRCRRRGCHR